MGRVRMRGPLSSGPREELSSLALSSLALGTPRAWRLEKNWLVCAEHSRGQQGRPTPGRT